ncbi:MAG: hypothetical protein K0S72_1388, partial [Arthrobacter sp.]|nr:hypothetical protein [Arthrobacter sp.]
MVAEVPGDAVGLGGAVLATRAASAADAVSVAAVSGDAAGPGAGAPQADITTITVPA